MKLEHILVSTDIIFQPFIIIISAGCADSKFS